MGLASCGTTGPAIQADDAALRRVVRGWSVGTWKEIHSAVWNEEAGKWEDSSDESPRTEWSVEAVEPDLVEFTMGNGARTRVGLRDGVYRDFGAASEDVDATEFLDVPIVSATVDSEQEWRLFLQWPPLPGATEGVVEFSELTRTGDLFTWSNWSGTSFDDKRRTSMSVNRMGR